MSAPACGCGGPCCGCCTGITAETPAAIFNRPGLSEIGYRAGIHATFKETMLARISALGLTGLRTRDDSDFSIALIDGWATVAEILTFYQERIANENYLRTATELVSIQELARLIGYSLRPGLAAATYVSFKMQTPPPAVPGITPSASVNAGSPLAISLDAGIKIQSIPGPGEQPQTFETTEPIEARVEWNELLPLATQNYGTTARIWVAGTPSLQVGDTLLVEPTAVAGVPQIQRVVNVIADAANNVTQVDLENTVAIDAGSGVGGTGTPPSSLQPLTVALARSLVHGKIWDQADLVSLAGKQNWDLDQFAAAIAAAASPSASTAVNLLRTRASIFGHNAPPWNSLPAVQRFQQSISVYNDDGTSTTQAVPAAYSLDWDTNGLVWEDPVVIADDGLIDLDQAYPGLVTGKWTAFGDPATPAFGARITASQDVTRTGFALTGKVTRLQLDWSTTSAILLLDRRSTKVLGQTDSFMLAPPPSSTAIAGSQIVLNSVSLRLTPGQKIEVYGQPSDQPAPVREVRAIAGLHLVNGYTRIDLDQPLAFSYTPGSARINANVASASQGESRREIAGSGDGSQVYQQFRLKQAPLTYVSAAVPSGAASTLSVQVNGVTWTEAPALYGAGPRDQIFITKRDQNGNTIVEFGDGVTGSRLPTGQDNIQLKYRQGLGSGGNVAAGALSQLLTRPQGLKEAANPLPASGGQDPETVEQSRANAPFTVKTLDRVVSLDDYQDFARASAGIAKALATLSFNNGVRAILITVAGPDGAVIGPDNVQYGNLISAISNAGDPHVAVVLRPYRPVAFQIAADVQADPARDAAKVLSAVQSALLAAFSFDARQFAQPVFLSEVITVIQNVTGVVATNVTALYRNDWVLPGLLPEWLLASPPVVFGNTSLGAELLTLDPNSLTNVRASS